MYSNYDDGVLLARRLTSQFLFCKLSKVDAYLPQTV